MSGVTHCVRLCVSVYVQVELCECDASGGLHPSNKDTGVFRSTSKHWSAVNTGTAPRCTVY